MSSADKHAYLIMAHHQFGLLKMLCQLLDHPKHDIFIHIDSKAENCPFEEIKKAVKSSRIFFTNRTPVTWGGYSQINCELTLLKAAVASDENYSYYHLVSGADLPLKTAEEIHSFFQANSGREFVQCIAGDEDWQKKIHQRVNHFCLFQEKAGRTNNIWKKRQNSLRRWQNRLEFDRSKSIAKPLYSGANWFSITHALAEYVLKNERWIKRHFSHTICADEVFLQTLIADTEFAQKLYCPMPQTKGAECCVRLVDWTRGEPYTFTEEDFNQLISSECIFARKFDIEKHPEICHRIYEYLLSR